MGYDDDGCPNVQEVYNTGDSNFHHISCSFCDTYWGTTSGFADSVNKRKETDAKSVSETV